MKLLFDFIYFTFINLQLLLRAFTVLVALMYYFPIIVLVHMRALALLMKLQRTHAHWL